MNKRRRGVSPVVATTIIIAVTLVVGFAVFSFVNGEAAAASRAMGENTVTYTNYLKERFVITNIAFNSGQATVWFYNNGAIDTEIVYVYMDTISSPRYTVQLANPVPVVKGQIASVTFNPPSQINPIVTGTNYYIKAVGEFGNTVLYYQKA